MNLVNSTIFILVAPSGLAIVHVVANAAKRSNLIHD